MYIMMLYFLRYGNSFYFLLYMIPEKPKILEYDNEKYARPTKGVTPNDVKVSTDRKRGHTNVVFNLNDEVDSSKEGRISVRF